MRGGGSWQLVIAMTDLDVIMRVHTLTGCGTVSLIRPARPDWKPQHRWRVCRATDISRIMTLLVPYLGERRQEKAAEFFEWAESPERRWPASR